MKRKLALFLVLALLLSLVPANVFASTGNTVNKVPSVADNTDFGLADAPVLRIEESNEGEFGTASQTFVLKLANAEWEASDATDLTVANAGNGGLPNWDVEAVYLSATRMQITLVSDGTPSAGSEGYFLLPIIAELQGEGAATVEVEAKNSVVTGGTYTFANGAGGDTAASIDDTTDFSDTAQIDNIVIEELVAGTIEGGSLKLKLTNNDFDWSIGTPAPVVTFSGGFNHAPITVTAGMIQGGNDLVIPLTAWTPSAVLGTIVVSNLEIDPSKDAAYGDVKVRVYGDDITTETITVGKYTDYTVTAEADDDEEDLPVLYSGKLDDGYKLSAAAIDAAVDVDADGTDIQDTDAPATALLRTALDAVDGDDNKLSQLNISEDVIDAWNLSRSTDIEFADGIKIIKVVVADSSNIVGGDNAVETALDYDPGDSIVSFDGLAATAGNKAEINLQFYVSIEPGFTGDIVATVGGRALTDEQKVVLGKAVSPVTAKFAATDVKIGVQSQATADVEITEYEEGVLADGTELVVGIDSDLGKWSATPDAKTTKGDVEVDDVEKSGSVATIIIDNDSSEPSTIVVSGLSVDVTRNVAEGAYNLTIGGDAIVQNYEEDGDYYFFDTDSLVDEKYVSVITPAPGDTTAGAKVVFTIGSADYMVGDTKMTSDVAPYINEQGRTMLPLRVLANALGVEDRNIIWNDAEHSVVIFKGDATLKVIIGQMQFNKNGVLVPMDTTAVIMNSRTFLPLRAMGEALGAVVTWDEATRTVTIN